MNNVLYIGQYRDSNGLGASCRRYCDWLSGHENINLSVRPLYVHGIVPVPYNISDKYNEYENNTNKQYDILIQQTCPDYLEYHRDFGKNIAIVEIETNKLTHTGWVEKLNMMDEIWVGSFFSAKSIKESGVRTTIKIVPEPYDMQQFNTSHDPFFSYDKYNKPYIFYTIGEYAEKKNIKSIIFAYLLEFNKNDNVKLFIKTSDFRHKNNDLEQLVKFDLLNTKNIIRKNDDYADIDVVCGYLNSNDIIRLHQSADCYINAVRSDSFGASAIEAALCNRTVINSKYIGSSTYFNTTNALMVEALESVVLCSNSTIKNAYTIYENWFEPSINDMRKQMRNAYNMSSANKQILLDNFNKTVFEYNTLNNLI